LAMCSSQNKKVDQKCEGFLIFWSLAGSTNRWLETKIKYFF